MSGDEKCGPVLPLAQRLLLVEVLDRETDRLYVDARKLDDAMSERWSPDEEIAEDDADYDQEATKVERAYDDANHVDELRRLFTDAKLVTLQPDVEGDSVATVARALVASWAAGRDVGEVLTLAVAEAQRTVHTATEEWLTSNRPGSWEAALLEQVLSSSGWDVDL